MTEMVEHEPQRDCACPECESHYRLTERQPEDDRCTGGCCDEDEPCQR